MEHVRLQPDRAYATLCSVCGLAIAPGQRAWHDPERNWHAHDTENCSKKLDKWVGDIKGATAWQNRNS